MFSAAGEQPGSQSDEFTQGLQTQLSTAKALFDSPDQSRAIPDLNVIVKKLEGHAQSGQLSPLWKDFYISALVMRGQILYGLGEFAQTEEDFMHILQADPDYRLDTMQVSPKIVADFDTVRGRIIGHLSVRSTPPVAEVTLDGHFLGVTPMVGKNLTRGEYRLRVSLLGYRDHEEIILIEPGILVDRDIRLEMTSGDCIIFTSPSGASVYLDGVWKGTTSGEAPAREFDTLKEHGLDPRDVSSPFILPLVPLGERKLTVTKRGWSRQSYTLHVQAGENRLPPVVLEPSRSTLQIVSSPPGALVFVDDLEPLGRTPLQARDIHTGEIKIRVQFDEVGEWFEVVEIKKDTPLEVVCAPRPTCLFAGIVDPTGGQVTLMEQPTREWVAALRGTTRLNLHLPGDVDYPASLLPEAIRNLTTASFRRKVLEQAKDRRADLVLWGRIERAGTLSAASLTLEWLSIHHEGIETETVSVNDMDATNTIVARIQDADLRVRIPWIGASLIDTTIGPGAYLIAVSPNSPAALADLRPGDVLVEAYGKPVMTCSDFHSILASLKKGSLLPLLVRRGDSRISMEIQVQESPRLLPLSQPDPFYNLALAEMLLQKRMASEQGRLLAQFNLGLCLMHFGQYEKALKLCFEGLRLERAMGINDGTIQYYMGECFRNLGYKTEAISSFQKATQISGSTFDDDDGLQVKPAAQARLLELTR